VIVFETDAMDTARNRCCIVGCANADETCFFDAKFYRFPTDDNPVSRVQRSMWVEAIQTGRYLSVKVKVTLNCVILHIDLADGNQQP